MGFLSSRHQVQWEWGPLPPPGPSEAPRHCALLPGTVFVLGVAGSGVWGSAVSAVSAEHPQHPSDVLCHRPALRLGVGICQKGGPHPLPCAWVGAPDGVSPRRPAPLSGRAGRLQQRARVHARCRQALGTENGSLSRRPPVLCRLHRRMPFPSRVIRGADALLGHLVARGSNSSARRCPLGSELPSPPFFFLVTWLPTERQTCRSAPFLVCFLNPDCGDSLGALDPSRVWGRGCHLRMALQSVERFCGCFMVLFALALSQARWAVRPGLRVGSRGPTRRGRDSQLPSLGLGAQH